jgi:hypothetical protein
MCACLAHEATLADARLTGEQNVAAAAIRNLAEHLSEVRKLGIAAERGWTDDGRLDEWHRCHARSYCFTPVLALCRGRARDVDFRDARSL